jgi:hypothetical protein
MLRFGLGLAIALGALPACGGIATAQTADTVIAASEPQKSRHSHDAETNSKSEISAKQPAAAVPPVPVPKSAKAAPVAPPPPDVWTTAEIDAAKARCTEALKGLDATVTPEPPIKEGSCGTPAPVHLVSMGKNPQVTFSPPALVNCAMLAPLHTWITKDLQPLAARQLGGKIVKIEVMSDYSCRTAFGRVGHKLSEHAYVDALDIRGFVTEKGQQVHVLDAWGATNRDIAAAAAAAKAKEEKLAAAQVDASKAERDNLRDGKSRSNDAPNATASSGSRLGTPGNGLVKATRSGGLDRVTVTLPGGGQKQAVASNAARLGGPDEKALAKAEKNRQKAGNKASEKTASLSPEALATPPSGPRARFLREAHAAACRIFGTTLGPEANEAHRNHFHVDMAERKVKKICD